MSLKLINSAYFLVFAKMLQRSIGLISLLILARLLNPEDFAVAAIISMTIYFFDVLSNVGNEQYIIQKAEVNKDDLNTAWTLSLLIKLAISLVLCCLIPYIDQYYTALPLTTVLLTATLLLPINALCNPGMLKLQRDLDYRKIFYLSIVQKITSFVVVITVVSFEPSYWALIIGDIAGAFALVLGSYKIHEFRPSFCLVNANLQWFSSKWILGKNILGYLRSQIDTFVVSRLFSSAMLGRFYLVRDIAMLPSQNILTPLIQPLLAGFSRNANNTSRLAKQLDLSLLVVTLLTIPIVVYIWRFPAPIINTLLGEKWAATELLMSAMCLLVLYIPFVLLFEQILMAMGRFKQVFWFDMLSLVFIFMGLMLLQNGDIVDFAWLRGILGITATLFLAIYLHRHIQFSVLNWLMGISVGLFTALISAFVGQALISLYNWQPLLELLLSGSIFVATYAFAILIIIRFLAPKNQNMATVLMLICEQYRLLIIKIRKQRD
jgi:O-antigen/teichoic acid export membrane protein